ncbi:MAG: DUF1800 domain-containing protein [Cyclobacteriaceae bacterium]|nr:DUF1800 domain-containing protein [Cyclobacteriaceae bacterium]
MFKNKDPRAKNKHELIAKYRKQEPVYLNSTKQKTKRTNRQAASSSLGLEAYSGSWGEEQIMHLLRRTLFGVKKADLQHYKTLTLEQSITELLTPSTPPPPPINDYNGLNEDFSTDPHTALGDTWIEAPFDNEFEGGKIVSLKGWWIKNIINQETSLDEKMILFWHNLLAIQTWDVFVGKANYQYLEMLRANKFGNFKNLIKELTLNPAMLFFLNGNVNHKEAPDENYGRELQELFCIGKGADANFTESDVQAAARLLTGWIIDYGSIENEGVPASLFWQDAHDTNDKQFSAFYNNTKITGKSGADGANELDEMLDMIFNTNELATYISRRLYNFFVATDINATVEQNMIEPMAELFRNSNYEIQPVLEALFKSAHFYDAITMGVRIKNPAEFTLGVWRTLEVAPLSGESIQTNLQLHASFLWTMSKIGMEIGDPPSVSGWTAYYQAPQFDKSWITTSTITQRASITDAVVFGYIWVNENLSVGADLIHFLEGLNNPDIAEDMLMESTQLLLGLPASPDMIATLKAILLSGQSTEGYWTSAWLDYTNDPSNTAYRQVLENRLKPTFQHILQYAEFELM